MTVKYNRLLAIFFLALGLLNLFLGGWLLLLGEFHFTLIIAILMVVMGVRYFTAPYFRIEESQVVVPALIGPVKRTYAIRGENGIRLVEGKTLETYNGREWEKVPVQKWFSNGADWQAMVQRYSSTPPQA